MLTITSSRRFIDAHRDTPNGREELRDMMLYDLSNGATLSWPVDREAPDPDEAVVLAFARKEAAMEGATDEV